MCVWVSVSLSGCVRGCTYTHTCIPGDGPCGRAAWVCDSMCLCVSLCVCVCLIVSVCVSLCLCVSLYVCVCTASCIYLANKMGRVEECLCLPVCVCLSVSVCLPEDIYIHTHMYLANKMGLVEECLCPSVCVCLSVSVCLCLSVCVCLSVSVCLCLSVCLWRYIYTHTHVPGKQDGPCGRVRWEKWYSAWTRLSQPFPKQSVNAFRTHHKLTHPQFPVVFSIFFLIRKCVSYASQANSPWIPCRFFQKKI
jgi:hypothetical protein